MYCRPGVAVISLLKVSPASVSSVNVKTQLFECRGSVVTMPLNGDGLPSFPNQSGALRGIVQGGEPKVSEKIVWDKAGVTSRSLAIRATAIKAPQRKPTVLFICESPFFVEVGLLNCFSWVLSQPIS